jgi:hypothetical protein
MAYSSYFKINKIEEVLFLLQFAALKPQKAWLVPAWLPVFCLYFYSTGFGEILGHGEAGIREHGSEISLSD